MAGLTDYVWYFVGAFGLCVSGILLYILSKSSRKPLPDVMGVLFNSDKSEATKLEHIPDDDQYKFHYDKYNFHEKINGREFIGLNPKTSKKLYKLHYGDNQVSDFTIEANPLMFRYPDADKALLGSGIREVYYADDDVIAKMQTTIDGLNLMSSGHKSKILEFSEGEKTRIQKTIEYQREQRRSALGSMPQQSPYGQRYGFQNWRSRMDGSGEEQIE